MLPGEVLIVQLSQTGPEDVLPAEERVMGEDQARDVHVQLVVSLRVGRSRDVKICILGLERLAEATTSSITIMIIIVKHHPGSRCVYRQVSALKGSVKRSVRLRRPPGVLS